MKKILILEDEEKIRSFVAHSLKRAGHEALEAATGQQALDALQENSNIDAVLLDITLPDMDGIEVCRQIREEHKDLGILMLSAREREMDKVTGLMVGADDFLAKPFSVAELTARLDVLLRKVRGENVALSKLLTCGPFILNTKSRSLEKFGQRIRLTLAEYSIVRLFMQNPGRALTPQEILFSVWGSGYDGDPKIVDVNIRRLRIKLEDDPNHPEFITTVWGFGYKWESELPNKEGTL